MADISTLNDFFVRIFYKILIHEQRYISAHAKDLSVSEVHVITSVARLAVVNKSTVTNIAKDLSLSPAALSIAVSTLVRKGYILRKTSEEDRRRVYVFLTEKGKRMHDVHEVYHRNMLSGIVSSLDKTEIDRLNHSLKKLSEFFDSI